MYFDTTIVCPMGSDHIIFFPTGIGPTTLIRIFSENKFIVPKVSSNPLQSISLLDWTPTILQTWTPISYGTILSLVQLLSFINHNHKTL